MDFCTEKERLYAKDAQGTLLAEITFPDNGNGVAVINHTYVHPSLQGQGVASQLVRAAADHLRRQEKKAQVTCSYAVRWFEKHPDERDVLV